jgi:hypothetical protein
LLPKISFSNPNAENFTHLLLPSQGIIDFHLQNENEEEEEESSESDYEGVSEYLDRLLQEEAECLRRAGSAAEAEPAPSGLLANMRPGEGGPGDAGTKSSGGLLEDKLESNCHNNLGGGSSSGDPLSATAPHLSVQGAAPPTHTSSHYRRSRTHSLDGGDGTSMEEAGLMSKEELLLLLRRVKDCNRRLLERAMAAEGEVAALRSQGPNGSLSNSVAVLRGDK